MATQVGLNCYLDARHPYWYDAEFSVRLAALQQRVTREPDTPLLVVLGSSRTASSFLPEDASLPTDVADAPLLFNCSHLGAGPVMSAVQLRRLRRAGIRPQAVVIEVFPPILGGMPEQVVADVATASGDDLAVVGRYVKPAWALFNGARVRLRAGYGQRLLIRADWLPQWRAPTDLPAQAQVKLGPLGGDYAWHAQQNLSPAEVERQTHAMHVDYANHLQRFQLHEPSVRALRDLLQYCRHEGIVAALLLSPESSEFQSWYPSSAWDQVEACCHSLAHEFAVPVVDARNWLDDGDFADGHHVQLAGARHFTQRLVGTVLVSSPSRAETQVAAAMPHPHAVRAASYERRSPDARGLSHALLANDSDGQPEIEFAAYWQRARPPQRGPARLHGGLQSAADHSSPLE